MCTPPQVTVVALPGTGSDADFAARAFGPAAAAAGLSFQAVEPDPRAVIASCTAALDAAAARGPVLAAGISLGAAIALDWAAESRTAVVGVITALPAWTGAETADCPAASSASVTAGQLRADGLEAVIARMRASSPPWLADALTQSWRGQWPHLPDALEEAAAYAWPTTDLLARVEVPVAVVGASDDPVHPIAVAEQWAATLPQARLHKVTLAELGADPAVLGRAGFAELAAAGAAW
ncbi:alpha/beta fold hydrolase [Nocardia neocaledoniensis]|uniref:alpha/beta fold hydrolase n=1 Tax=Nocardia neocaledoniensis TaxID=236511 RepID=UPI0024576DEA|nr:alpha/beta hydrolase [Nocardia neocaledoniensis]